MSDSSVESWDRDSNYSRIPLPPRNTCFSAWSLFEACGCTTKYTTHAPTCPYVPGLQSSETLDDTMVTRQVVEEIIAKPSPGCEKFELFFIAHKCHLCSSCFERVSGEAEPRTSDQYATGTKKWWKPKFSKEKPRARPWRSMEELEALRAIWKRETDNQKHRRQEAKRLEIETKFYMHVNALRAKEVADDVIAEECFFLYNNGHEGCEFLADKDSMETLPCGCWYRRGQTEERIQEMDIHGDEEINYQCQVCEKKFKLICVPEQFGELEAEFEDVEQTFFEY